MNNTLEFYQNGKNMHSSNIKNFFALPRDTTRRDVNISDLNRIMINLDDTSPKDLENIVDELKKNLQFQDLNPHISTLAGCPKNLRAFFMYSKTLQTKERHSLYELIEKTQSWEGYLEILSKSLVYREIEKGSLIPAPNPNNSNEIEYYKVDQKFITGKGFTALALDPLLTSSTLPKILVCSGSNFHPAGLDALSSYISDTEFKLGAEAYASAENELNTFMQSIEQGSLVVTGHSLGGNLAQQIAARFPHKLRRVVTYNSPGVSKDVHQLFRVNAEHLLSPLKIDIYQTAMDIVDLAGEVHLGHKNVQAELSLTRFYLDNSLITLPHTYLCLSNPSKIKIAMELFGNTSLSNDDLLNQKFKVVEYVKINQCLDNAGRNLAELIRKIIGGCLLTPSLRAIRRIVRLVAGSRGVARRIPQQ